MDKKFGNSHFFFLRKSSKSLEGRNLRTVGYIRRPVNTIVNVWVGCFLVWFPSIRREMLCRKSHL